MTRKLLALGAALALALAAAAIAQAEAPKTSVRNVARVEAKVTVESVDLTTRKVTVRQEDGRVTSFVAPDEVRNLPQLKAGDTLEATYLVATEFTQAKRGQKTPENEVVQVEARAAEGQLPAAGVVNRLVVTGAVVGVDTSTSTLKLVNPTGGQVHAFPVESAEGKAMLANLKPGDRLTAEVTESLVIGATR